MVRPYCVKVIRTRPPALLALRRQAQRLRVLTLQAPVVYWLRRDSYTVVKKVRFLPGVLKLRDN